MLSDFGTNPSSQEPSGSIGASVTLGILVVTLGLLVVTLGLLMVTLALWLVTTDNSPGSSNTTEFHNTSHTPFVPIENTNPYR